MSLFETDNDNWQLANDNWQKKPSPTFQEVEKLANELCEDFNNKKYFKWYCLVINILGIDRIRVIQAMYSDIHDKDKSDEENKQIAAKLFSKRVSQEAKQKAGVDQIEHLKGKYGRK